MSTKSDNFDLLGNKVALSVIRYLLLTDGASTGRQIAIKAGYSPQATLDALNMLESSRLINSKSAGKSKLYAINRDHYIVSDCLAPLWAKIDNWEKLAGQYYMDHLAVAPLSIIMYGSRARGDAGDKSDLDLLFVYEDKKYNLKILDNILELDSALLARFGVHPSPKAVSVTQFKKGVKESNGFLRNVYREGRSVAGLGPSEVMMYGSKKD